MFGSKKSVAINATCVIPLTEGNLKLLKAMQMNHPIPPKAKYIAFLENGDVCFLESITSGHPFDLIVPQVHMVTYYTGIKVTFDK